MTLDSDIIARIKELAEADDRSFSQSIDLVWKNHAANSCPEADPKQDITP